MTAAPDSLLKAIHCNCSNVCRTFRCSCRRYGLPCTAVCGPCQHQNCDNPNKSAQSNFEEGRVTALSHVYAVKSPFVTMVRPKFAPKSTPSRGPIAKPHYCHITGRVRPMTPNGIRIRSAVFPQCTGQTDARTHRPTDRPRESLIAIGRCATRAMRPNNRSVRDKSEDSDD